MAVGFVDARKYAVPRFLLLVLSKGTATTYLTVRSADALFRLRIYLIWFSSHVIKHCFSLILKLKSTSHAWSPSGLGDRIQTSENGQGLRVPRPRRLQFAPLPKPVPMDAPKPWNGRICRLSTRESGQASRTRVRERPIRGLRTLPNFEYAS